MARRAAPGREPTLRGRADECALLDTLVEAIRRGEGRSLVVRGEAGIGKTALLDHLARSAPDLTVLRAMGVESEMELAYAGLHQLCAPLLDRRDRLPAPQRQALEVVYGIGVGAAPDRFLVGLAVLSLLSEAADERPILCLIDDAQWLDRASALTLAFVAHRLLAERVGVVFAAREPGGELARLPELEVRGLPRDDARALLRATVWLRLDAAVRDRIVAETHGNPLALLELPRGLTATQLAGGFGLIEAQGLVGRIEDTFLRRVQTLSDDARRLLLVAAAEPVGDPLLLLAACERLGVAVTTETDGLLALGERVTFRHPLVRSAVYRTATTGQRREVHQALAEATDRSVDPDRRAWHLATAAARPSETIAAALEQSAGRAQARGGLAAAAAFLHRAAVLSADPTQRSRRVLVAAQASLHAGMFEDALELLALAEASAPDEVQSAHVELLRGQIAFASSMGTTAASLLMSAAQSLEPLDPALARETYLDAWGAALFAGRLASAGSLAEVSRAAASAPRAPQPPCPSDLLLDALATLITDGRAAAAPLLRQATATFAEASPGQENVRWGWMTNTTTTPPNVLWDEDSWQAISARNLKEARDAGALARLPIDLADWAIFLASCGDFGAAAEAIAEAEAITTATGTHIAPYAQLLLAALRGQSDALPLFESTIHDARTGGQGLGVQWAEWTSAILFNGLRRYDEALGAARRAAEETPQLQFSPWALTELIEAAARTGRPDVAAGALEQLIAATAPSNTDWGRGIEARCRALVSEGEHAERLHREAIDRLAGSRRRPDLARAHLLYGEWLRREKRRGDARVHLHAAHDQCASLGMEAFAERARAELIGTGEKVRQRTVETRDELTPQERQIARLARDGMSNPEIGARLFLSPRTVEWHLRNVFSKLGIRSRRQLRVALPSSHPEIVPA
jgi:DNA-binding CsgD family transcriptional regulator/tetratricopeptide (TPR) repeat protein